MSVKRMAESRRPDATRGRAQNPLKAGRSGRGAARPHPWMSPWEEREPRNEPGRCTRCGRPGDGRKEWAESGLWSRPKPATSPYGRLRGRGPGRTYLDGTAGDPWNGLGSMSEQPKNVAKTLTNATRVPVTDNEIGQTAASIGLVLMSDERLMERMAHFDQTSVPERVIRAKPGVGTGHSPCRASSRSAQS